MVGVSASVNLPLHHKSPEVLFWHWHTRVVPEKGPYNGCGGGVCALLIKINALPLSQAATKN